MNFGTTLLKQESKELLCEEENLFDVMTLKKKKMRKPLILHSQLMLRKKKSQCGKMSFELTDLRQFLPYQFVVLFDLCSFSCSPSLLSGQLLVLNSRE